MIEQMLLRGQVWTCKRVAEVIRRIPEHTGALAILLDHHTSLVSASCATTAVHAFGKRRASGPLIVPPGA